MGDLIVIPSFQAKFEYISTSCSNSMFVLTFNLKIYRCHQLKTQQIAAHIVEG